MPPQKPISMFPGKLIRRTARCLLVALLLSNCTGSVDDKPRFSIVDILLTLLSVPSTMDSENADRFLSATQVFFEGRIGYAPVHLVDMQTALGPQQLGEPDEYGRSPLHFKLQILVEYALDESVSGDVYSIEQRAVDVLRLEKDELVSLLRIMASPSSEYFDTVHDIVAHTSNDTNDNDESTQTDSSIFGVNTVVLVFSVAGVGLCITIGMVLSLLLGFCRHRTVRVLEELPADQIAEEVDTLDGCYDCEESMSASTVYKGENDNETISTMVRKIVQPSHPTKSKGNAVTAQSKTVAVGTTRPDTATPKATGQVASSTTKTTTNDTDHVDNVQTTFQKSSMQLKQTEIVRTQTNSGTSTDSTESISSEQRLSDPFLASQNGPLHLPFRLPAYITRCPPRSSDSVSTMTLTSAQRLNDGIMVKRAFESALDKAKLKFFALATADDGEDESVAFQCDDAISDCAIEQFEYEDIDETPDDFGSIAGSVPGDP